jgi:phosphoesterase RecJ-like protein
LLNDPTRSSTGELIYWLAKELDWQLNALAQTNIMAAILGDTQGLTNELATARTYHVMAELTEAGVSRPELEDRRRQLSKMPLSIFRYKATLIDRTEFSTDQKVAVVTVDQSEINEFSPLYNPVALIQPDLLLTDKVEVAIVLKRYDDQKVTGAIRCNPSSAVASDLAQHFGGGGHPYASGFKLNKVDDFNKLKRDVMTEASNLLSRALPS